MSEAAGASEGRANAHDQLMDDWSQHPEERPDPVAVPHAALTTAALRGVVESFVLREGTDYGDRPVPHEQKVAQVLRLLELGEVRIMFDPVDSSVTIVVADSGRNGSG